MLCQKYCTSQIWKPCARLLKYYAQGIAVFILTVRQRKKRKSDNKNLGQLTKFNCQKVLWSCADPGIFVGGGGGRGGGVQVSLTKKALTTLFFSPQLILQKSNGQFKCNLSFFKVPEEVQHFPGGGGGFQLFPRGGPIANSL